MRIVDIQIARLQALVADRRLQLEVTDEAKRHIADAGYDPAFGARPLRRVVQRTVLDPLALMLLEGEAHPGDVVRVDVRDGEVVLDAERGARAPIPATEAG